ncbi:uncharacterized protein [Prorops nasuta]|uniref:uncharacterized protein n=1 Tax=Prorops nasuta TaxID=863751 RepID=UPI0034CE9303
MQPVKVEHSRSAYRAVIRERMVGEGSLEFVGELAISPSGLPQDNRCGNPRVYHTASRLDPRAIRSLCFFRARCISREELDPKLVVGENYVIGRLGALPQR